MSNVNLKPCPFCGSTMVRLRREPKIWTIGKIRCWGVKSVYFVECLDCDVRTGNVYKKDALMLHGESADIVASLIWNRRQVLNDASNMLEKLNVSDGLLIDIRWKLNQIVADIEA